MTTWGIPILSYIAALRGGQRGQTVIDYALILALFSIVLILALQVFQGSLATYYQTITDGLP